MDSADDILVRDIIGTWNSIRAIPENFKIVGAGSGFYFKEYLKNAVLQVFLFS